MPDCEKLIKCIWVAAKHVYQFRLTFCWLSEYPCAQQELRYKHDAPLLFRFSHCDYTLCRYQHSVYQCTFIWHRMHGCCCVCLLCPLTTLCNLLFIFIIFCICLVFVLNTKGGPIRRPTTWNVSKGLILFCWQKNCESWLCTFFTILSQKSCGSGTD